MSPRISPEAAQQEARRAIGQVVMQDRPDLAGAIAAGRAGPAVHVQRLDAPEQGYYLVPWRDERGIVLIVQVDAERGQMSSLALQSMPLQQLVLPPAEVERCVAEQLDVPVLAEPTLVWMPCRESASSFLPLYRVAVEGGSVFVAMDGTVHRRLTPMLRGG